jgi:hypothetical protein
VALGGAPIARRPLGVEDLRAVERRGHRRQHWPRARVAHRVVDRLAGERPRDDLPVAAGDRGQDLDAGVGGNRRVLPAALAVDEHVDVLPDQAALVDDPAAQRGMLALELAQQLEDRGRLELVLPSAAGQLSQRAVDADAGHCQILRLWAAPKLIVDQNATFAAERAAGGRARRPDDRKQAPV